MPINRFKCLEALEDNQVNLSQDEYTEFHKLCEQGVSIAQLFREEIPRYGVCKLQDANDYIAEESKQMEAFTGKPYDMDNISVAEHVLFEDTEESLHRGLPKGYTGVPGAVKFFVEWLEGHHPALGCVYGSPGKVPSDLLYEEIAEGRKEATKFR